MKKSQFEQQTVVQENELLLDIICNRCGESCWEEGYGSREDSSVEEQGDPCSYNYFSLENHCTYLSRWRDGFKAAHLCERCFGQIIADFVIPIQPIPGPTILR